MKYTQYEFILPCEVQPKQSARFGRRVYQTAKVKANAHQLAGFITVKLNGRRPKPLVGPAEVYIRCDYAWTIPKKHWPDRGWLWKDTAPDVENLAKQVNDVLEKLGFFEVSDGQIARAVVEKRWAPETSTTIRIGPA